MPESDAPPEPVLLQPGALVRLSTGVVGEWTGRVSHHGLDWMLEIEIDGTRAWWNVDFLRPAYEGGTHAAG